MGIILELAALLLRIMSLPNEDNMASQVSLSIRKNTFSFVAGLAVEQWKMIRLKPLVFLVSHLIDFSHTLQD